MEQINIYSPSGELIINVLVDDTSYCLREIMGANSLQLRFSLPEFVPIPEGSYCDFISERYWMPRDTEYVKEHSENFGYSLNLEGSIGFLKSTKFKFFDYLLNAGQIEPTSPFKLKFPITATPQMIADLIITNLKLKYPEYPWTVGNCILSEPVLIDFNHDSCYDVLPKTVDAFKTEWELDKFTLNIGKVEKMKESAIDLSYGYNNGILGGLRRMQYDNTRIINRVYVEGGDRNIDRPTYGNDTLLLPKSRLITYEGIDYTTDPSGSYLERVAPLAGAEDSLDITKYYPKRVGTVSAVEVINDATGLYNILDSSIPVDLDFSKRIISGETMTVIFQTGQLAGKEFEVNYIHATRKFELVPITDNGLIYPQGNIIPAVGDTYAVFHMRMPESYITDAENEALQETVEYLWKNEQPQYSYRWSLDSIYAKRNWAEIQDFLDIGYFVRFSDPQFLPDAVTVRIVTVKIPVNDPQSVEITIANNITGSTGTLSNKVSTQEATTERTTKEAINEAKKTARSLSELAYLKAALANNTEIDGGLILTSLIKLGAILGDEWIERAGMAGTSDDADAVAFWAGGTLDDAINGLAAFIIRMDGSGQFNGTVTSTDGNNNKIILDAKNRSVEILASFRGSSIAIGQFMWETSSDDTNDIIRGKIVLSDVYTDKVSGVINGDKMSECTISPKGITFKPLLGSPTLIINSVIPTTGTLQPVGTVWSDNGSLQIVE